MKFHPKKCKVLSVSLKHPNYYILPFNHISYELDNKIINYYTKETDLGVTITNKMSLGENSRTKLLGKRTNNLAW